MCLPVLHPTRIHHGHAGTATAAEALEMQARRQMPGRLQVPCEWAVWWWKETTPGAPLPAQATRCFAPASAAVCCGALLSAPCSLLPAHCSLLTAHCSLLTAHCRLPSAVLSAVLSTMRHTLCLLPLLRHLWLLLYPSSNFKLNHWTSHLLQRCSHAQGLPQPHLRRVLRRLLRGRPGGSDRDVSYMGGPRLP